MALQFKLIVIYVTANDIVPSQVSQPKTVAATAAGVAAGAWFSCDSWISRTTRILVSILFIASIDSGWAEYHTGLSGTHDGSGVR